MKKIVLLVLLLCLMPVSLMAYGENNHYGYEEPEELSLPANEEEKYYEYVDTEEEEHYECEYEPGPILSYEIVIHGFDWGPAVTNIILTMAEPLENVMFEDFSAFFTREPRFRMVGIEEFTPFVEEVPITGWEVSLDNRIVSLYVLVHPNLGINPFTYVSPTGNNWSSPFCLTVVLQGEELTPRRVAKTMPLTELFEIDGVFTYEGITLQYASFTPPQAERSERPLIIWLHGGTEGSRGNTVSPESIILGNRVTRLVAPQIQQIMGGAFVLLPQSPTMWMSGTRLVGERRYASNYEDALLQLIDYFIENNPGIDRSRIYVGGCSNGGYMTMRLLFERPDFFAAAFPVCLLYNESWVSDEKIESIRHIPIWFIHDINDPTAPHAQTRYLYDRLNSAGAENVHLYTTDGIFSEEFTGEDGEPLQFNYHWAWVPVLNNAVSTYVDGRNLTLFHWMAIQSTRGGAAHANEPLDMVQLRPILVRFGVEVSWDTYIRAASIQVEGETFVLPLGVPLPGGGFPEIRNDHMYVPARFLAELFGVGLDDITENS